MLRGWALALLLINAFLLAWALGAFSPWLSPPKDRDRDPVRVTQQVRPQTVELLPPAASAPASAAPASSGASAASAASADPTAQEPPPQKDDRTPVSSAPPSATASPAASAVSR